MAPVKPSTVSTTGNRQSTQPRKPHPTIVGRYKVKPVKVPKGLILKKRGGNKGYVTVRKPATAPGSPGAAAAAPTTPDPKTYPEYADFPWAQRMLAGLDRDQASHQGYATTVGDWLGKSLQGLTGVDPNQPGINPQAQQQYLANVQGQVGSALNAAATATPMTPGATTAGGIVQGNNAFLGQAARTAAAQRSSAALQMAQVQSNLNTLQSNTYAQGAIRAYADMQAGLPALYANKRNEARTKIDQFIMEQQVAAAEAAEKARANRVDEAIRAQNAQTNAAIAFGQLGLKADDQAFDQTQATTAASAPAPYGYNRDPATGDLVRDPSIPNASSAGSGGGTTPSASRGEYVPNKLRKEGYVGGWKVKPKNVKGPFVRATDGTYWRKPKGGSGSSASSSGPRKATELESELLDLYKKDDIGGWEERYEGKPAEAGKRISLWVRENKRDFIVSGRKANIAKLKTVLGSIGGRPAAEALSIIVRGYIGPDGNWK